MEINETTIAQVFHAYDIRGLTPSQLDKAFFYELGKAFVTFLKAKKIAVGYDIRPDSKIFSESFSKGAIELGCDVINLGQIATEVIYFATGSDLSLDGGVTITASHNPAGWSGAKLVAKGAKALSKNWGLAEIKKLMLSKSYSANSQIRTITFKNILPEFKSKILQILEYDKLKPLKIVVDAGNGIGGIFFDYIFGDLGLNVTKLYFEPDGNFPNHVPDPLKEENVSDLKKEVLKQKADLGIAIDGDADRVFFIDSKGRNPSGIYTGSVFAKFYAQEFPNAKIIHDPRVIWPITKEIIKLGAVPIINQAGHSFFKDRMKSEDAILGVEMSSHFFYKDFYYADSGMMTIALMLKLISRGLDFVSEMNYFYSNYINSGEINYKVDNSEEIIRKVQDKYRKGKLDFTDGLSIEFEDWRFNLRKSNTEPLVRLNIEAKTVELLQNKFAEIEKMLKGERQNIPSNKNLM